MPERLPAPLAPQGPPEWIDRGQPLGFRFEGRACTGLAGDSVTSALLASDVAVLGRSFKYHRPRGACSVAGHDANVLLQSAGDLNLRGDTTPLAAGMDLRAVNTRGGVARDRARLLDRLSPLLPVGFYYKAFHRPRALFPFWESQIRAFAGLGRIDPAWRPPRQAHTHAWCDLLVVGAGASGLAAAVEAAGAGARVIVAEESPRAGGSLTWQRLPDDDTRRRLLAAAHAMEGLDLRLGVVACGWYTDHRVPLAGADGITLVRARAVLVATGAVEQPAVFRGNDLPGVMLASGAQRLLRRYGVRPCRRAVVLAANPEAYDAALDLLDAGVEIAAVADLGDPPPAAAAVAERGVPVLARHGVHEARARGQRLAGVVLCPLAGDGTLDVRRARHEAVDGLLMAVGWAPAAGLLLQAGADTRWAEAPGQALPEALPPGVFAAGRVNGVFDLEARLADGRAAAREALAALGCGAGTPARPPREARPRSHPYPVFAHPKGKNFVDLDEDVTLGDLEQAAAEGFDSAELMKRYTTTGMGPSQGRLSGAAALRILARLRGEAPGDVGATTARPFERPVPLRQLAGRRLRPVRRSPLHDWHLARGARMMHAGHWLRPQAYGDGGTESVARECLAVRQRVGLVDVSTLGKIEAFGADAGELLERVYTGRITSLKPGRTRYGLMVDEAGVITDDGVVARLDEDRYYLSTTTTGAAHVHRELQRLALEWGLEAYLLDRTSQVGAMNLAGPRARDLLQPLTDVDLDPAAFPFLGAREGAVAGVPALLLRVGFVGELGYEIHVPAGQALHVWETLMDAGRAADIAPFGVDAQRQLRLEKGHLIVGQDTDGTTTPWDVGMDWAVKLDKPFFVGQRSLEIQRDQPRRRLVGFALDPEHRGPLPQECHLVVEGPRIAGRITSIGHSPGLGHALGLALVDAQAAAADHLDLRLGDGALVRARVTAPPFYDPGNLRQQAEPAPAAA